MTTDKSDRPVPMGPLWIVIGVYGLALLDMPYGYYMITRLITCGVALWLIWHLYSTYSSRQGLLWILGGVAVLYNPLIPIYLNSKPLWSLLNLITIAVFWFGIMAAHQAALRRSDS